MTDTKILEGKTQTRRLNNHKVVVVVPSKPISYEKGVKKLERLVKNIKKER